MAKKELNRYVATVDFYVWADSDEDAIYQARHIAAQQSTKRDDRCSVIDIVEQPQGKIGNRKVVLK